MRNNISLDEHETLPPWHGSAKQQRQALIRNDQDSYLCDSSEAAGGRAALGSSVYSHSSVPKHCRQWPTLQGCTPKPLLIAQTRNKNAARAPSGFAVDFPAPPPSVSARSSLVYRCASSSRRRRSKPLCSPAPAPSAAVTLLLLPLFPHPRRGGLDGIANPQGGGLLQQAGAGLRE